MNNVKIHNRDTQNNTLKKHKLKCDNDKKVLELAGLVLRRDKTKHLITLYFKFLETVSRHKNLS